MKLTRKDVSETQGGVRDEVGRQAAEDQGFTGSRGPTNRFPRSLQIEFGCDEVSFCINGNDGIHHYCLGEIDILKLKKAIELWEQRWEEN